MEACVIYLKILFLFAWITLDVF